MVCVTSHADIEIQPCRRVSPLRRKLEGAAWATKCELEARGNVEPLLTAAARDAFGNLGVGTLRAMCESCLLDDGGEEFDLVYRLADHALGTDVMTSEEGLRILEKRKMPRNKDFDTDILTMPEVSDVLERREVEAVDAYVASKEDAILEREGFKKRLHEHEEYIATLPLAKKAKKVPKACPATKWPRAAPKFPVGPVSLEQLQRCMPPGSYRVYEDPWNRRWPNNHVCSHAFQIMSSLQELSP